MARLILDTSVLVRFDRGGTDAFALNDSDDIAVAAVTIAELRQGVLAADAARRPGRERFVQRIEETAEVLPYTRATALEHAMLLDHVRRTGRPRGALDLIIAAHARQTGRLVVSLDARADFEGLPGVGVLDPSAGQTP